MKKMYLVNDPVHNGTEIQRDGEIELAEKDAKHLVAKGTLSEKPEAEKQKPETDKEKKAREDAEAAQKKLDDAAAAVAAKAAADAAKDKK